MEISIIIPLFNEEENIEKLFVELYDVLRSMDKGFEVIAIDDGSTDNTFAILQKIHNNYEKLKIIRFGVNFGQTAAIAAGFNHAEGDTVITIDGDLQNDPKDIPALVSKAQEGFDVVSGWRKNRKDSFITRRLPSYMANKLISRITGVHLHDYGCTLKAYRRDIVKKLDLYGEMHRFIPALARWIGASIAEIEVNHRERTAGKSKYGLMRTLRVMLDLITVKFLVSFSTRPSHIFGVAGLLSGLIGFFLALYLTYQRTVYRISLANRPVLLLAVLLIFTGIQLISIGLIGEMLARTYHESQGKPVYVIKEILEKK